MIDQVQSANARQSPLAASSLRQGMPFDNLCGCEAHIRDRRHDRPPSDEAGIDP
jgi:hypothetical protein